MPRLSEIRGQDRAVARLRAAIAGDKVHHAYLFSGPASSGKRTTALALAAALNCQTAPGEGCADCDSCAKIAAGIHPDVVTLEREGAAQIVPIEVLRREVIGRIGLPPHEARVRMFIVDEASALQPAAANSLLKTLEEPPSRTMFVLATVAPDQLLPTIRSRCQRVAFAALAADERARLDGEGDDAAAAAATADRLRELAEALASFAGDGPLSGVAMDRVIATAGRIAEDKGSTAAVVDLAARRLHEIACERVAAGDASAARVCGARAKLVLDTHLAMTIHNAHPQLALEALLGRLWHLRAEAAS